MIIKHGIFVLKSFLIVAAKEFCSYKKWLYFLNLDLLIQTLTYRSSWNYLLKSGTVKIKKKLKMVVMSRTITPIPSVPSLPPSPSPLPPLSPSLPLWLCCPLLLVRQPSPNILVPPMSLVRQLLPAHPIFAIRAII